MEPNTIPLPHYGPRIFVAPVSRVLWTWCLGVRGVSCWNQNSPPMPFVLKILDLTLLASIGSILFGVVWVGVTIVELGGWGKSKPQSRTIKWFFHVHMDRSAALLLWIFGVTNCNATDCCLSKVLSASEASLSSQCVTGFNSLLGRSSWTYL